jgi:DNA-binding NtrC family response regulator
VTQSTRPSRTAAESGEVAISEQTQTLADTSTGPAPLAARVRIINANAQPATFRLGAGICRIGAGEGVDVLVHDKTVSRIHAELELVREGVAVRDLDSRNGTYLYGQRIQRAVLSLGSRIMFGRVEAEIAPDLTPEALPLYESDSYGRLIGGSIPMRRIYSLLSRLEGSLASVLIAGETGTGKELAARALHDRSHVANGPFVSVNCGALEKNLARSELFGHARGAFTGAVENRAGAFEAANGGTLFLDEIGELPVDVQPLLLRAVEQGVVVRVGETQERSVKVRLLAATHRDLRELLAQGRFREDLYYRLMVVKVTLPPLRDRLDDVPLLVRHFSTQLGLAAPAPEVIERLRRGKYPGNVRELKNAVEAHAAIGTVPDSARNAQASELESALRNYIAIDQPYARQKEELLHQFLDIYVELLLTHTGGNQSEAARLSGLERSYLNRVLRRKR